MKLTDRQKQVFDVLGEHFEWPGVIARAAGIRTRSPSETAAKFCIQLTRLGLAEKGGDRTHPKWRRFMTPTTPAKIIRGEG